MTILMVMGHESICRDFSVVQGTVTGAEHLRLGRGNQDGVATGATADALAVAVTDGCSEGRYSEVGARLAAEWLAAAAPAKWRAARERPEPFVRSLSRGLAGLVHDVAGRFGPRPVRDVVAELFLFTFIVAVVGRERAAIVGVGDGVYMVDGRITVLDAGPDNAPSYIAYDVVGASHAVAPRVHYVGPASDFDSLLIATDGAADLRTMPTPAEAGLDCVDHRWKLDAADGPFFVLDHFASFPKYRRNKSLVHKRLQVMGRYGRLPDDTTVAAIFRKAAS